MAAEAKEKSKADPEVKAMTSILRTLNALEPSARQRVLEYVNRRCISDQCISNIPTTLTE